MPLRILGRFDGPSVAPREFAFAGARLTAIEGGVAALALRFEAHGSHYELRLARGSAHGEFPGLPVLVTEGEVETAGGRFRSLRCPSSIEGFVELTLVDAEARRAVFVGQQLEIVALQE
jgi:hypothetical protein